MTRLIWLLLLVSCSLAGKEIQEFDKHYGKIETTISMCPSSAERSFCLEFAHLQIYPCKNMTGGGEFLSLAFYGKNDTYLDCPTKTGKFHLKHMQPDLVPRPKVEGYFILRNKGYLHGKLVMCYVFEVNVASWMGEAVDENTRRRPKKKSD